MGVRDTKDELCDYWPHDNSEAKPLGMRNLNPFAFHYQTVALLPPIGTKEESESESDANHSHMEKMQSCTI